MLDVDYFSAHHALIEDQKSSPYEINLGWTVSETKGPYNGRRALREEKARGPAWASSGSRSTGCRSSGCTPSAGSPPHLPTVAWRASAPIYRSGQAGRLRDERLLVAAAQEVPRARARRRRTSARRAREVELEMTVEHRRKRATRHGPQASLLRPAEEEARESSTMAEPVRRDHHRRRPQRPRRRRLSRARRQEGRSCSSGVRSSAARPSPKRSSPASSSRCSRTS